MITAFDITIKEPNKKQINIFTSIKADADKEIIAALFKDEVIVNYCKKKMPLQDFEAELKVRHDAHNAKQFELNV